MQRGKRRWGIRGLLLLLFCAAGLTGACSKNQKVDSEGKEGIFCKDVSIFDCQGTQSFCDKGMLRIEEGLMFFYEYGTGRSYPLCSNAYCKHEPYSETNPDPVCEATLEGLKYACIYGENVYVVQEIGWQTLKVQVRNLKESGYRIVAEIPYCAGFSAMGFNAVRGDKAYLFLGEIQKTQEVEDVLTYTSDDLYTSLVELDLKTGKHKTLFCIEEGDRKYKVLRTVYAEQGIYMQWYYEDTYFDVETMLGGVNEYWDKFFYVSYDGTEKKELCQEVGELTAFDKESPEKPMVAAIGEQGVYYPLIEENILKCYRYEKEAEKVYEQPIEKERLQYVGESGNYLLISAVMPDGGYCVTGTDLTTKEEKRMELEKPFIFLPLCDGVFEKWENRGGENYRELWKYEDIFSENGSPFLTIKE